ncbi:dTDP-4-dehydrorhamnose reductase [Thermoproteota archaeon]
MKLALLGATGLLGSEFKQTLENLELELFTFDKQALDICSAESIKTALSACGKLDFVINCAAYTDVDACETHRDLAFAVNSMGAQNLGSYCADNTIALIHFSTDYVFDGEKQWPYIESDSYNPINIYGLSKLEGENAIIHNCPQHYIFRIEWLYGKSGPNFIDKIINASQNKKELNVVADQWGSPTYAKEIVRSVIPILEHSPEYGLYHLANRGYTTWYHLAEYVLKLQNSDCRVIPISSEEIKRPAKRPHMSALNISKFLDLDLVTPLKWQEAVKEYLKIT